MDTDIVQGKLKQVRGAIKQAWGKATDDCALVASGERDVMMGRIQVRAARAGLNDPEWMQVRPLPARPPMERSK
jgi:uncharacterized protein YjbJ (UPF0337 family)